jgi:hypothetical protein
VDVRRDYLPGTVSRLSQQQIVDIELAADVAEEIASRKPDCAR